MEEEKIQVQRVALMNAIFAESMKGYSLQQSWVKAENSSFATQWWTRGFVNTAGKNTAGFFQRKAHPPLRKSGGNPTGSAAVTSNGCSASWPVVRRRSMGTAARIMW